MDSTPAQDALGDDDPYDEYGDGRRGPSVRFAASILVAIGLIAVGLLITAIWLQHYPIGVNTPQVDRCGTIANPLVLEASEGGAPLADRQAACDAAIRAATGESFMVMGFAGLALAGAIGYVVVSVRARRRAAQRGA